MSVTSLLIATTDPRTLSQFLLPYAVHFRRRGWRVDAVTGSAALDAATRQSFDTVHQYAWSRSAIDPRNAMTVLAARDLLCREHYDIVHTHTPVASLVLRTAAATLPACQRPAIVYTAHGFHFHSYGSRVGNTVIGAAERLAGMRTDRLVVINHSDLDAARGRLIVPEARLRYMPGIGVDLSWYQVTPELQRAASEERLRLGLTSTHRLFAMVAELHPRKNHLTAVRALALNGNVYYHLALAGSGSMRRAILREARSCGVEERVHLLGGLGDVRPLMLAADAVVLISWREGLSRAVLEALALGRPVLGSRVRGIADLVEPAGGVLVEPSDIAAVSRALDAVLEAGPVDALQLQDYSLEHVIGLHEKLYAELLAQA
jgi:glycosyltransferase involved in cell wall biosynthesis